MAGGVGGAPEGIGGAVDRRWWRRIERTAEIKERLSLRLALCRFCCLILLDVLHPARGEGVSAFLEAIAATGYCQSVHEELRLVPPAAQDWSRSRLQEAAPG
jgi:hypothetical protein